MGLMDIFVWLLFGAVVGWVASKLMGTDAQQGLLSNILVGILGAFVGGFLAGLMDLPSPVAGFDLYSFFIALVGAVVLLWVVRLIRK